MTSDLFLFPFLFYVFPLFVIKKITTLSTSISIFHLPLVLSLFPPLSQQPATASAPCTPPSNPIHYNLQHDCALCCSRATTGDCPGQDLAPLSTLGTWTSTFSFPDSFGAGVASNPKTLNPTHAAASQFHNVAPRETLGTSPAFQLHAASTLLFRSL